MKLAYILFLFINKGVSVTSEKKSFKTSQRAINQLIFYFQTKASTAIFEESFALIKRRNQKRCYHSKVIIPMSLKNIGEGFLS
jgi:hypothetical protein